MIRFNRSGFLIPDGMISRVFLDPRPAPSFPPVGIRGGAPSADGVDVIAAHSKMAPKVLIQIHRSRPQPARACREHGLTSSALKVARLFVFFFLTEAQFNPLNSLKTTLSLYIFKF